MGKRATAAIKYDRSLPAPFVLARGRGERADRLLSLAHEYGVPVRTAPELADRLVDLEPGTFVPEELFGAVAEVLVYLLSLDDGLKRSEQHEKNSRQ